jgi:hypothetical protein
MVGESSKQATRFEVFLEDPELLVWKQLRGLVG